MTTSRPARSGAGGWPATRKNYGAAEELGDLRQAVEAEGLKLEAIENFDPAHWHDVLLDGPKRNRQLENVKTIIRNLGQAGIPDHGLQLQHCRRLRTHHRSLRARRSNVRGHGRPAR